MKSMKLLRELKTLLLETKTNLSELEENQKPMIDKKTEWSIYQDLKKLGEIDKKKVSGKPPPPRNN